MALTVQEVIDEITGETGDSDTTTQAKILIFIKDALRVVSRLVKERSIINRTTLSLAVDAQTIDISTLLDFHEEYSMWIEVEGRRNFIIKPPKDRFNLVYSSNATGRPELFRIVANANTIEFERKADQAYTVTFEYLGTASAVTVASTLSFRDDVIKVIKDLAFIKTYRDREEESKERQASSDALAGLETLDNDFHRQEDPDFITSEDDSILSAFGF